MKTKLLIFALLISSLSFSQRIVEEINSVKLNQKREVMVVTPPSYETETSKKYPVLVLLDGDYLVDPFDGILKYGNYWDDLPELIIVAIRQNYGSTRDKDTEFNQEGVPVKNGAKFFEFIGMEVLPFIEAKYRTVPFRIIAGHGKTAALLNAYLYKDNPVFNGYISLGADMAYGMEFRVAERLATISNPIHYYHATGEADLEELHQYAITLDQNITSSKKESIKYKFDDIAGATHYSLVSQAIPNALYFLFDGYQPISMVEYEKKIAVLNTGFTEYLINRYKEVEQKLGFEIKPRLSDFKAIEAAIIKNKAYSELPLLAKYANKHYPKTTLSVYHEALYLEKMGEYKKAVKMYQRGFTVEPIRELTKDFMLDRAEAIKNKADAPKMIEEEKETPAEENSSQEKPVEEPKE